MQLFASFSWRRLRFGLLVALLFAMPLSLHPSFSLPLFNFPTFRIGLYQALAVLFVLAAAPLMAQTAKELLHNKFVLWGSIALDTALVWGLLTTTNIARTALYSASLVSLVLLGWAGYAVFRSLSEKQRALLPLVLLWSGLTFGILTLVELDLVSLGILPAEALCAGCVSSVFGFPRVNLTAAEPQFLANSLLPALFAAMFFADRRRRWLAPTTLFVVATAIAVTFSRGAYLAIIVALAVYVLYTLLQKNTQKLRDAVQSTVTVFVGFVFGLVLLVASASYIYRDSPYVAYNTSVSALSHVTLGLITLPEVHEQVAPPNTTPTTPAAPSSTFDPEGFVAASSNDRLGAAETALNVWNDTPLTALFGVGMGNLGGYVRTHSIPNAPADLTVYIFYVLLLAELGLVGLTLLIITLSAIICRSLKRFDTPYSAFAALLTVAFAVQLTFFGSYINVMYLYLLLGIFLALPQTSKPRIIKTDHAKQ